MTLTEVIGRLEKASRRDPQLDIELFKLIEAPNAAVGTIFEYKVFGGDDAMWRCKHPPQDFGSWWHVERYTESLDASLSNENIVSVVTIDFKRWTAVHLCEDGRQVAGEGATEAIARRIASLLAREHATGGE